jgi:hypothetical protein
VQEVEVVMLLIISRLCVVESVILHRMLSVVSTEGAIDPQSLIGSGPPCATSTSTSTSTSTATATSEAHAFSSLVPVCLRPHLGPIFLVTEVYPNCYIR